MNDDLSSNISDGWGENGIPFGQKRWMYYDKSWTPSQDEEEQFKVVPEKDISKITQVQNRYFYDSNNAYHMDHPSTIWFEHGSVKVNKIHK